MRAPSLVLSQFERAHDQGYSLNNQEHCKNECDDGDARRDANEQGNAGGDANESKERFEGAVRDFLAEDGEEKRDDAADESERAKELRDDDGEEEGRTHGQETHEDGKNAAGNKPSATS